MHVVKGAVRAVCAVRTRKIHSYINTYGGGTYADTALKTAMRTGVKKMRKNQYHALNAWYAQALQGHITGLRLKTH